MADDDDSDWYYEFDYEAEPDEKPTVTRGGLVSKPYTHQLKTPLPKHVFPGWSGELSDLMVPVRFFVDWLDGRPYGCHVACFEFAVPKFLDVAQSLLYFRVTERGLAMSRKCNERRFAWMREQLASCLQRRHPVLPLELCLMISDNLVPEYAVAGLVSQWPHVDAQEAERQRQWYLGGPRMERAALDDNRGRTRVDRTADVWARYVHIDGVRYVASLSNERNGNDKDDSSSAAQQQQGHVAEAKLHVASEPAAGISMVEDHLGITDLQFFRDKPVFGHDWTVDVKLRDITDAKPESGAGGGASRDKNKGEESDQAT
ncbi:uncharacterized protein PG986_013855 [Apiospora aurea]|uniref:Uncharacterized protein n=1 Tax=Apiospora aurea TaxID=335848 RepID=A0ABR1PX36_9PEZI